jgi:predicted ribonuclease toxin of YeeF-YezG toxin-antitoxin module
LKELAVKEIHKGTETSKIDLDTIFEQLSTLQQKVRNFNNMEDALKGKTGKAIRSFYNEIHTPFLTFLLQSMEDYKGRLEDMKNDVQSFESSHQGFISESFLRDELTLGLDNAKLKAGIVTDKANQTLSSVADIVSVKNINQSDFEARIDKGNRQIATVVNNLNDLDSKHAAKLEETQSDLQTLKKYLSEMTTGLSNGAISISDFDASSLQDIDAYQSVIHKSYGNKNGDIEVTEENVEHLPMAAIAAARRKAEKGMDEGIKVLMNQAYKDLEQGKITPKKYHAILSTANKKNGELTKEADKENTETFIEYTNKNWDKITQDISKDALANAIEQLGIQTEKIGEFARDSLYLNAKLGLEGSRAVQYKANSARTWTKYGRNITSTGKFLGMYGVPIASAGYGVYEDVAKKGKTGGEAITHNSASFLAGAAGSYLGTAALGLVVSNPGGWAIGAAIGGGVLLSNGFNYLYDNNIWGIQDGLDKAGEKLDQAWDAAVDHVDKTVDSFKEIGEGIKGGIASLNPINWRWEN